MDKNIVAFLRDDVRSISVKFFADNHAGDLVSRNYTYLTIDPDIKAGDVVVVMTGATPKAVLVVDVHDDLAIEPNEIVEYKFIVGKVDMAAYDGLIESNNSLKKLLAEGYRSNLRKQFKTAFLDTLPDDLRTAVKEITHG